MKNVCVAINGVTLLQKREEKCTVSGDTCALFGMCDSNKSGRIFLLITVSHCQQQQRLAQPHQSFVYKLATRSNQ